MLFVLSFLICPISAVTLRLNIFKALIFPDSSTGKTGNIAGNATGNFACLLLLTVFCYGVFLNVLTFVRIVFFFISPVVPALVSHLIPATFPAL